MFYLDLTDAKKLTCQYLKERWKTEAIESGLPAISFYV
jgi:hypothetical protein